MKAINLFLIALLVCGCTDDKTLGLTENTANLPVGYAVLAGVAYTKVSDFSLIYTLGASNSVSAIADVLIRSGFKEKNINTLSSLKANDIKKALSLALSNADDNDLVVFYFFGHGSQTKDSGEIDEDDGLDELLIASDRALVDDELYKILASCNKQTRVLFIVDACHSGTSYRIAPTVLPLAMASESHQAALKIDFLHFGACRDAEFTFSLFSAGRFTTGIRKVFDKGKFVGNYDNFFTEIEDELLSGKVHPQMEKRYATETFLLQKPFKLN